MALPAARRYITPTHVERLLHVVWDGKTRSAPVSLPDLRKYTQAQIAALREDHLRPVNPTPYKVSLTSELYTFLHDIWNREVPIPELC